MRRVVGDGILRVLLVCPTGGGKTVLASHIIESAITQFSRRVLFVAHRIELINQTAKQLAKFGVTDIGVIRGNDDRVNPDAMVQVASIDTLRNREKPPADIVFVDEAHRALANSYLELFVHYKDSLHIGLTATPFRTDNQGLGEVYKALVICAKPSQLIADKFIVEPRIFVAPILPDLDGVDISGMSHDYHNAQLAAAMQRGTLIGNLVEEWKKHAAGRRTVVFAVNIEHSKKIVEAFRAEGIAAAHLDANTSEDERTQILLRLEKYEIQVVSNCDVLSEGWDQPSVKCVALCRPTQSTRLHLQQCGRILRPWEGDVFSEAPTGALILDHAGNCFRHGLPQQDREFDLQYGQRNRQSLINLRTCDKCYAIWSGTSNVCPECGNSMPVKERPTVTEIPGIALMEADPRKMFTVEDQQRHFYLREIQKCREKGMKVGAASYRFKDKFGKMPPWSWTQQAKQMMAADPEWQRAIDSRTVTRNHWQSHMQEQRNIAENPEGSHKDHGFTEEPEETQNWWNAPEEDIPF